MYLREMDFNCKELEYYHIHTKQMQCTEFGSVSPIAPSPIRLAAFMKNSGEQISPRVDELSTIANESTSSTLINGVFRQFTILFPDLLEQRFLITMLDVNLSSFSNLVVTFKKLGLDLGTQEREYGFFLPNQAADQEFTYDLSLAPSFDTPQPTTGGQWLNNDVPFRESLASHHQILLVKARTTPRQIALHLLTSTEEGEEFAGIESIQMASVKVPDKGEAVTLFTNQCLVSQVISTVLQEVDNQLPSHSSSFSSSEQCCLVLDKSGKVLEPQRCLSSYYVPTESESEELKLTFHFQIISGRAEDEVTEVMDADLLQAKFAKFESSVSPDLIAGERVISTFYNTTFCCSPYPKTKGTLYLTNYQLIFQSSDKSTYVGQNFVMRVLNLALVNHFCLFGFL
jgi:hypothetical protein